MDSNFPARPKSRRLILRKREAPPRHNCRRCAQCMVLCAHHRGGGLAMRCVAHGKASRRLRVFAHQGGPGSEGNKASTAQGTFAFYSPNGEAISMNRPHAGRRREAEERPARLCHIIMKTRRFRYRFQLFLLRKDHQM